MANQIYLRRGTKAGMPRLGVGEPGWAYDTKELYVGGLEENELVASEGMGGPQGPQGEKGEKGDTGEGLDGESAYEIALANGFAGTEMEWLETLVGAEGKSAYELAVEEGFVGTLEEWLESLKGEAGAPGADGSELTEAELKTMLESNSTRYNVMRQFAVLPDVAGVSAIMARGTWNKFQFLFDASSDVDFTSTDATPQIMGEQGRVGLVDGFVYLKNTNANNTSADVPEPTNSEVRLYDEGKFEIGNLVDNISIDPVAKTLTVKEAGVEGKTLDLKGLVDRLEKMDFALQFLAAKHPAEATGFTELPVQGTVAVPAGESFKVSITPDGSNIAVLEVDHSLQGLVPEFNLYASEVNPYGSEKAKEDFEEAGVEVVYTEATGTWEIDFGITLTNLFKTQANVRFYFVAKDVFGTAVFGSMSPTTPANTRTFVIQE